jgi:hypothetical protein
MTVPASPQSITAGPVSGRGVTSQSWLLLSAVLPMSTPRARSPAAISSVSRLRSGAMIRDGPVAWAARMSARLVSDFDPGTATVARTGRSATGACQAAGGLTVLTVATGS